MRITTNKLPVVFASLMSVEKEEFEIKSFTDKETGATTITEAPNGKPVYRTELQVLLLDDKTGKPTRVDKSATVSLIEPCVSRDIGFCPTMATKNAH